MKGPMILPWIAHKAGISEARAQELWREAIRHATEKTGWVGTPEYWREAEARLYALVERERAAGCLPTPELSPWVRLAARIGRLPWLAAEAWTLVWARALAARVTS